MDEKMIAEMLLYNRLVDDILILGNNAILRMNVVLYYNRNKPSGQPQREYYHRETQYIDKNGLLSRKVHRNYDAFLTLENLRPVGGNKEYILLFGRDLELMRIFLMPKLEAMVQNFGDVFQVRSGKLYVNEKLRPIEVELSSKDKYLWFKPGVHKLFNDEVVPAMELYLNSPNNVSIMSFQNVYELIYIMRTFQIHLYASNMLAAFSHPPMGFNMFDMSLNQEVNPIGNYKYEEPEQLKLKRETQSQGGFFGNEMKKRKKEK